jgi:hypothetical protein
LSSNRQLIKLELENIESNFGNIIEMEGLTEFDGLKAKWNEVIVKTSKDLLAEEQFTF